MLSDGGGNALDLDGVQVLAGLVRPELYELLHVHVVREAAHEDVNVPHDLEHVQTLQQEQHEQPERHEQPSSPSGTSSPVARAARAAQ